MYNFGGDLVTESCCNQLLYCHCEAASEPLVSGGGGRGGEGEGREKSEGDG